MKLKYFIPSLVAVVAAMLTGCSDDNTPTLLDEVRVSSSYVTIDEAGGSTSIDLTAIDSWAIDATTIPSWLTISPVQGNAGDTKVSFSAGSTNDLRDAELMIECAGKTQRLIVSQGQESTQVLSVAEALSIIKANQSLEKSIIVKGIVCKINEISPSYGNATYFISDDGSYSGTFGSDGQGDGNWLEIYRGYWLDNEKFTTGDEFDVGDELTIKGILMSYKGTPETKEKSAYVLSQIKSLIKVDSLMINGETVTDATLPAAGGEISAAITCKGTGVAVEISENAKDWLFVSRTTAGSNPTITFRALANTKGDREGTVTFKTTDGSKEYTAQALIKQKGVAKGSGTKDDPFNVVALNNFASQLASGKTADKEVYVKGIVSNVKDAFSSTYGNATYSISDDGTTDGQFLVYRSLYLGNKKYAEGQTQIKTGDEVVVCGTVTNYNGTLEFAQGKSYLVSLNGDTGAAYAYDFKAKGKGDWTLENVMALPEGLNFVWQYDSKYGMKASAFVNSVRYATDNWLVSPAIKVEKASTMTFKQALNYATSEYVKVMYTTTNGSGAIKTDEWKEAEVDKWPAGNNWTFIESKATLPAGTVRIAFRYTSDTAKAATWEIESLSIE
jgi:DNA/RNA endonuclease YhcR with UshA esterase domain